MGTTSRILQAAVRRPAAQLFRAPRPRLPRQRHEQLAIRSFATLNPKESEDHPADQRVDQTTSTAPRPAEQEPEADEKPGAIGGFMRGLIGGQSVAVEDAFIAEAKEQGVELPPPPPPRRADLVPVKRRKRREEDSEGAEQTIRDRIFGRFAGSAFMQGAFNAKERIAERIDESDNPIINMFRNVYDRFFAENEMAMVVREIREEDNNFRISEFLSRVETEMVPGILGAYLEGNRDGLKKLCTEEAYAMLNASIRERETEGIVMDTNILDVSDVELTAGKLLEDSPVLIVSFSTQQINCLRDKGGNIVEGREDDIRAVYYAWALAKEAEYEDFAPTGGGMDAGDPDEKPNSGGDDENDRKSETDDSDARPWKLMEMVIRGAHSTI